MTGLVTDFNQAAADLLRLLPDLTSSSLTAAGLDPAAIPVVDFRLWNVMPEYNKCYSFATDTPFSGRLRPGDIDGTKEKDFSHFCELVRQGMRRDRHIELGYKLERESLKGRKGWLAALFLAQQDDLSAIHHEELPHDFHFYALRRRENNAETRMHHPRHHLPQTVWATKMAERTAEICFNPDVKAMQLSTPDIIFRHARGAGYNYFGGYYLVNRFDPDSLPRSKWAPSF